MKNDIVMIITGVEKNYLSEFNGLSNSCKLLIIYVLGMRMTTGFYALCFVAVSVFQMRNSLGFFLVLFIFFSFYFFSTTTTYELLG